MHEPPLGEALRRCAEGRLPPNVALMQLLLAGSPAEVSAALAGALASARGDGERRLLQLMRFAEQRPEAAALVEGIAAAVDHRAPSTVESVAAQFDRAARLAPDAGSALYTLGDPELIEETGREIARYLLQAGLLGAGKRVAEIGCGSGRILSAIAPHVRYAIGTDISAAMLAEAARRTRTLANVLVCRSGGQNLAFLAEGRLDLLLFVDSFPYLIRVSPALARAHLIEAARALTHGGSLWIANFSYRGDIEADATEAAEWGMQAGLSLAIAGEQPFSLWDGAVFHLRKG